MSVKSLKSDLAAELQKYNKRQAGVLDEARKSYANFDSFAVEIRGAKLAQLRSLNAQDFERELDGLLHKIPPERTEAQRERMRLMFPATMAKDTPTRTLGELHTKAAKDFLAGKPDAAACGEEGRECLLLGKVDAAWYIIQFMRQAIPPGGAVNDEGRAMQGELMQTLEQVAELQGVVALETEIAGFAAVERIAQDVLAQVKAGRERVVSADLFTLLTPEEQNNAMVFVNSADLPLQERIHFKQRTHELLTTGA